MHDTNEAYFSLWKPEGEPYRAAMWVLVACVLVLLVLLVASGICISRRRKHDLTTTAHLRPFRYWQSAACSLHPPSYRLSKEYFWGRGCIRQSRGNRPRPTVRFRLQGIHIRGSCWSGHVPHDWCLWHTLYLHESGLETCKKGARMSVSGVYKLERILIYTPPNEWKKYFFTIHLEKVLICILKWNQLHVMCTRIENIDVTWDNRALFLEHLWDNVLNSILNKACT